MNEGSDDDDVLLDLTRLKSTGTERKEKDQSGDEKTHRKIRTESPLTQASPYLLSPIPLSFDDEDLSSEAWLDTPR